MSKRRTFTKEKKLEILRYAEEYGMVATCHEYELSQSLFYRWKHAFESKGVDGLEPACYKVDPQVRDLEKENERLRKIIAKQALEPEVKSELIKKTTGYKGAKGGYPDVQGCSSGAMALLPDRYATQHFLLPVNRR